MRRPLAILFKSATVLSLVLCVATVVLWVRGHFVIDLIGWESASVPAPGEIRGWYFTSTAGGVSIARDQVTIPKFDAARSAAWDVYRAKLVGIRSVTWPLPLDYHYRAKLAAGFHSASWPLPWGARASSGFIFDRAQYDQPPVFQPVHVNPWRLNHLQIGLPNWLVAIVTAILPGRAAFLYLRRRRDRKFGLCAECGYDLRATPERCPECGTLARQP